MVFEGNQKCLNYSGNLATIKTFGFFECRYGSMYSLLVFFCQEMSRNRLFIVTEQLLCCHFLQHFGINYWLEEI